MDYFISDTHFGHENIIRLCNRPFTSLAVMEAEMIARWNSVVSVRDRVWVVGDFSFHCTPEHAEGILKKLNGEKHLIVGNHDHEGLRGWASERTDGHIKIQGQKVHLYHYPIEEWNGYHRGSYHIHGHVHGNHPEKPNKLIMDVSADAHNFTPVSWDEVVAYMKTKTPDYYDNHRNA